MYINIEINTERDISKCKNKLFIALWRTNYVMATLFLNYFKPCFGISVLQFFVISQHKHRYQHICNKLIWADILYGPDT